MLEHITWTRTWTASASCPLQCSESQLGKCGHQLERSQLRQSVVVPPSYLHWHHHCGKWTWSSFLERLLGLVVMEVGWVVGGDKPKHTGNQVSGCCCFPETFWLLRYTTGQSLRCAGWVQMRRNTSIYNWLTYMRLQNAPSCPCWLEKI